jgi:hypothetical protein
MMLKIKWVRLNINPSRQHIKKSRLFKSFTVSFETGVQTVNAKWITALVNISILDLVIITSSFIHKQTMPQYEVHDTSTTNSSIWIWCLQIFALFNFLPMTVMSGYCISNPERYATYTITLCKCDRDRYDFAKSTDYSNI